MLFTCIVNYRLHLLMYVDILFIVKAPAHAVFLEVCSAYVYYLKFSC